MCCRYWWAISFRWVFGGCFLYSLSIFFVRAWCVSARVQCTTSFRSRAPRALSLSWHLNDVCTIGSRAQAARRRPLATTRVCTGAPRGQSINACAATHGKRVSAKLSDINRYVCGCVEMRFPITQSPSILRQSVCRYMLV